MSTYYTTIDEQFSGTSLNSYWLESYGTGTVTVGSGSCTLKTVANAVSDTGISPYLTGLATDTTPLLPQTSTSQVIAQAALTPNGAWGGGSSLDYQCALGVQSADGNSWTEISAYSRTTTQYTIFAQSPSVLGADIASFNNGTKLYFRISIDSSGAATYEYSTNGSTWTAISFSYTFPTNKNLFPYAYYDSYGGPSGAAATCLVDDFTYEVTDPPKVSFTTDTVSGVNPLTVAFTDTSPGTFTAWSWDFGDGNTSTSQSPSHTYTTGGVYDVSLEATDYVGTNTYSVSNLINVGAGLTGISTLTSVSSITFS